MIIEGLREPFSTLIHPRLLKTGVDTLREAAMRGMLIRVIKGVEKSVENCRQKFNTIQQLLLAKPTENIKPGGGAKTQIIPLIVINHVYLRFSSLSDM